MRISHVVRGTRPLTAELALRLERYFSQSARYWLQLQSRYGLDMAQDEIGRRVSREVRRCKAVAYPRLTAGPVSFISVCSRFMTVIFANTSGSLFAR